MTTTLETLKAALLDVTSTQQATADALASGSSHTEAASAAGVARETVTRWAGHHPGFRAYLAEVRAAYATERAAKVRAIRDAALDAVAVQLTGPVTVSEALAVLKAIPDPGCSTEVPLPVAAELFDRERHRLRLELPALPPPRWDADPFDVVYPPSDDQRAEALAIERLAAATGIAGELSHAPPEADR